MSPVPAPLIPDAGVLIAVARGDNSVIELLMRFDAAGQPLVISTLALVAAHLDIGDATPAGDVAGLQLFDHAEIAALAGNEQATSLARVITQTGLDPWDAHIAAIADASICVILTLDAEKWREPALAFDHHLVVIEVADVPDDE